MIEPLVAERMIEFDGQEIGYVSPRGDRWWSATDTSNVELWFSSYESAQSWLVQQYALKQESQ